MPLTPVRPDPNGNPPGFLIAKDDDWSISVLPPHNPEDGPPIRANGMTVGILEMASDAPHNGEMHPDGDEFLHVISGEVQVSCDSHPEIVTLGPGESCIISKGEWHNVHIVVPTKLIHITPGPGGEHRPLGS